LFHLDSLTLPLKLKWLGHKQVNNI
jgi:hypothetical protein